MKPLSKKSAIPNTKDYCSKNISHSPTKRTNYNTPTPSLDNATVPQLHAFVSHISESTINCIIKPLFSEPISKVIILIIRTTTLS